MCLLLDAQIVVFFLSFAELVAGCMFSLFEVQFFSVELFFEMVVGLFEPFDLSGEFLILKLKVGDLCAHSHD